MAWSNLALHDPFINNTAIHKLLIRESVRMTVELGVPTLERGIKQQ
uniref:Uncharacterized protein n=1 Tax=Manihot esculenta TaxID=3983 RepID=A0A2C9WI44_MANES